MLTAASRKNVVIAMALAGAALLAFNRWVLPALFDLRPIRDGAGVYARDDARLRLAVWEAPRPLAGELDTSERESHARTSPDGRWLVYSAGEPGADCELYLAEVVGGAPTAPRVLAELNSAADELAPSWGEGALYFCSDRAGGAGGFDLYRAAWDGATFGAVEALAAVNTAANECDPAPGDAVLVFASDRDGAGFDLFVAPAGGAATKLEQLSSASDERDPFLTPDGRALYFATNRARGGEDFDLWRSFFDLGEWLAPERVAGLDSRAAERAPATSPDGLTLHFTRAGDSAAELLVSRSIELFRGAAPARGWADLWLMAALLLLALVAALSKRWEELDLLYKCALASVIAHLLVLLLLRELRPDAEAWDKAPPAQQRIRVRLETPRERGIVEREGRLETERVARSEAATAQPERIEFEARDEDPSSSSAAPLALESAPLAAAPQPERVELERTESASAARAPAVELPGESRARRAAESVAEALPQPAATRAERSEAPAQGPALAQLTTPALAEAAPAAAALPREAPERTSERIPAAQPSAPPERSLDASALAAVPRVDLPAEARARNSAAADNSPLAPARSFELQREAGEATSSEATPERVEIAGAGAEPARELAPSNAPSNAPLERAAAPQPAPERASAFASAASEPASRGAAQSAAPQLELPREERQLSSLESRPADEAPAPRALAPQRRAAPGDAASSEATPERVEIAGAGAEPARELAPSNAPLERAAAPQLAPERASAFASAASEPASRGAAQSAAPQLELPREERQLSSLESRSADDAPAPRALAPQRRATATDAAPSAPLAASAPNAEPAESAAPALQPLEAAPRAAALDTPPAPRPLDDTPYRSRFGTEKEIALREHGGSEETERAVANGLRYLASRQRRDGSWGSRSDAHAKYRDVRVGKSGLALLAFLGAGHTPGSPGEYARVSEAAVNWLLATQDPATGHFGDCEAYGHGIATYALAECFALTRDERLGGAVRRAVERILAEQITRGDARSIGGWSYFYPDGAIFDRWPRASIAAWQVMALESARLGGIDVPDEAFARAREFLRGSWDAELGRFRYSHDPQRLRSGYATLPGSTPAALFALSLLGEDLSAPRWRQAVDFVSACAPNGYRWEGEDAFVERAGGNLYFWYYGSLALLRRGGDAWERWNVALKESLPPAQAEDGSWAPLDVYSQYAGDDERDRVYSTAMCVLSLEVYYRYFTPLLEVR